MKHERHIKAAVETMAMNIRHKVPYRHTITCFLSIDGETYALISNDQDSKKLSLFLLVRDENGKWAWQSTTMF